MVTNILELVSAISERSRLQECFPRTAVVHAQQQTLFTFYAQQENVVSKAKLLNILQTSRKARVCTYFHSKCNILISPSQNYNVQLAVHHIKSNHIKSNKLKFTELHFFFSEQARKYILMNFNLFNCSICLIYRISEKN